MAKLKAWKPLRKLGAPRPGHYPSPVRKPTGFIRRGLKKGLKLLNKRRPKYTDFLVKNKKFSFIKRKF